MACNGDPITTPPRSKITARRVMPALRKGGGRRRRVVANGVHRRADYDAAEVEDHRTESHAGAQERWRPPSTRIDSPVTKSVSTRKRTALGSSSGPPQRPR